MKNLFLVLTLLLSFSAFAQYEPANPDRPDMERWITYEFYTCDSDGYRITDQRHPKYKKYTIEILQTIYGTPPTGILYPIVQQISDQICQYGELQRFYPNVRILDIEYSSYIGIGDPITPDPIIIKPIK
ncbi:hypothetical protein [Myroides odoratus]|uniref:hypothetical protein n=1 Tax=Myroides odoratus TaxID=256 RepID=UPI0007658623|nr:hypothetical protein [Myroides odoratus]